jgi:Cu-Zn family superoxide dismutase
VAITGDPVLAADGIVLRGRTLDVVQNFRRQVTTLTSHDGWRTATTVAVTRTAPDRTFTTAKLVRGELLLVDSTFGFAPDAAVAADRVLPLSAARVATSGRA